jgi:threonine dehydratase
MRIPARTDVEKARDRIAGRVRRTPVLELADGLGGRPNPLALKLELHQHTGSFKIRGAFNRLLGAEVPRAGVVAASGGNHGAAVAYAASKLGVPVRIFMPATAAPAKVERVRSYGAEPVLTGKAYADARSAALEHASRTGALDVPAFDDAEVVSGQGTVALEFAEQSTFGTLLVAVGGGGLAAGCAAALGGSGVRLVAVETPGTRTLHAALAAGSSVDVEVSGLAADSLGARRIGEIPFAILRQAVERVVLVEDEDLRAAQRVLWDTCRVLAEPGGVAALAAWLSGRTLAAPDERVGIVICGGNVDPASLVT